MKVTIISNLNNRKPEENIFIKEDNSKGKVLFDNCKGDLQYLVEKDDKELVYLSDRDFYSVLEIEDPTRSEYFRIIEDRFKAGDFITIIQYAGKDTIKHVYILKFLRCSDDYIYYSGSYWEDRDWCSRIASKSFLPDSSWKLDNNIDKTIRPSTEEEIEIYKREEARKSQYS